MSELKPEQNISVEIVSGIEGLCLLVNDCRVAGPKPWGGGKVVHSFQTKQSQIDIALRRAQPENEPLTLEQLKQMDGEPVYIVTLENQLENPPYWAIVGISKNDSRYQGGVTLYNKTQGDWGSIELYGKTWLAYRHKPKEEHHEAN